MNCKEVERFLPLFAGGDLAERLQRPVSRHLQSCASCALVARDYHQSAELLQQFAAPAFSDEVYAEIRRSVWRQIDAEPPRASRLTILGAWLRPPMIFAPAAALLIALSAAGIYFIRPARGVREPVVANSSRGSAQPGSRSVTDQPAIPFSWSGNDRRQVDFGRSRRRLDRRRAPDRAPSVALNSPDGPSTKGEAPPQVNSLVTTVEALPGREKILRMEMQTRNPNIRIIWFAQQERKSIGPNSKGT
jgi:hypothetical protein